VRPREIQIAVLNLEGEVLGLSSVEIGIVRLSDD